MYPALGWAGLELGAWREFGGSSERDNRTNGALSVQCRE